MNQPLQHLQEYANFFAQNIWQDERYGLTKNEVILLARIYFPLYFQNNPQININDPKIFQEIITLCQFAINFPQGTNNYPPPNIPQNLPAWIIELEKFKTDQKALDALRKKTYYNLKRQSLGLDTKKSDAEIREAQATQNIAVAVSQQTAQTLQLTQQNIQDFVEAVVAEMRPPPPPKPTAPFQPPSQPQLDFDNALKEAVKEWESQNPQQKTYSSALAQAVSAYYQNNQAEIQDLFNQQKKYYPLLTPENDETTRNEIIKFEAFSLTQKYKIDPLRALEIAERQVDAEIQINIYTNVCTEAFSLIEKSIAEVKLTDPQSAKILKKKQAEIAYDVASKIAIRGNLSIHSDQELIKAVQNVASTSAEASVLAHTDLPHGPSFRKAGKALKTAVANQVPQSQITQIAQNHQSYSSITPDPDGLGLGIAYEGIFSFIISPTSEKISGPLFEFFKGFGERTLEEYGKLPALIKHSIYSGDQDAVNKLFTTYDLSPEQKVAIQDFFKKFQYFSGKHKIIAGAINILSKMELEKAQFSPVGIGLTVLPAFFKGVTSRPDMAGQYAWYFAKQYTIAFVKQKYIRPRLNALALKLGTHTIDRASHQIRFKFTFYLQKNTVGFFKKITFKLGLKAPLWLTKFAIPGFGPLLMALDFLGGPLKRLRDILGFALLGFYLWLYQFGIAAILGGLAGGIVGAVMGFVAGNIPGAIIGFALGTVGGGLLAITISKALGGIGGFFSGLVPTASAAGLPALTTGFASAAAPITLGFVGVTAGLNLFYSQFMYMGFNPYRDVSNVGAIEMNKDLGDLFQKAAQDACIPVAALKAISQIEAARVWTYSEEEIAKFSQYGWWKTATPDELKRGYCTDTCAPATTSCAYFNENTLQYCPLPPPPTCRKTTVYGPMQFEELTWTFRVCNKDISNKDCLMKRCVLPESIKIAASKIKDGAKSTSCTSWDEATVKKAAEAYCGSCGVLPVCGPPPPKPWPDSYTECYRENSACGEEDYCEAAWENYQAYE